jgi:metal-responsive CopG/Arc/MetJ family transcriptional regulator
MTREQFVGVRLTRAGTEHVDQRAEKAGVSRSEMIRRMLAYAAAKMPEGWTPK